jgi:hypothetical protein
MLSFFHSFFNPFPYGHPGRGVALFPHPSYAPLAEYALRHAEKIHPLPILRPQSSSGPFPPSRSLFLFTFSLSYPPPIISLYCRRPRQSSLSNSLLPVSCLSFSNCQAIPDFPSLLLGSLLSFRRRHFYIQPLGQLSFIRIFEIQKPPFFSLDLHLKN